MKTLKVLILVTICLSLLWACEKDGNPKVEPFNYNNAYFPLQVGNSITYQIEEINIDKEIALNDTVSYQIKELIESITKQTDEYVDYRAERYFRMSSSSEWEIKNVWQIRKYDKRIHKIEENIEYVRLLTPVKSGLTWDGNTFNVMDEQLYSIKEIKNSLVLEQIQSVLTVEQESKESLIDKILDEEQYAENIGLIKKQNINVTLTIDPSKPWEERVLKGTIFRQSIIDFKSD